MDNLTRTILAMFLSLLVLIAFQYIFSPPKKTQEGKREVTTKAQKIPKEEVKEKIPQPIHKPVGEEKVRDIKVETTLYTAIFTTKGGTIKSWYLKKHKDKYGNPVTLLKKPGIIPPLGVLFEGSNKDALLWANYKVNKKDGVIDLTSGGSDTLTFEYSDGVRSIKKSFTFYGDKYKVDMVIEANGTPLFLLPIGTDFGIYDPKGRIHHGPVLLHYSDRKEFKLGKLKKEEYFEKPVYWIAQEDKYFAAALAPIKPENNARVWGDDKHIEIAYEIKQGREKFLLYAGPKEYDRLKSFGLKLEHLVNFGWTIIQPIARPIFWFLKFLYSYLHNYGLAIIVLTIIIRLPFMPLISKGQQSMKKLQTLQPKIMAIREKYKDDPERMNRELMELYKTHKANPIGGCLPMLIQVPFFIALYNVLNVAVELRMAPFYWWIKDLSSKDPYYILPVIMGITMLIQQKMTPSTADPAQAKLMMLLPIVFTLLFINFPSGLVLYWLVNNILAIIQQYFINKKTA